MLFIVINLSKEEESNDENISKSIDIECSYITSEKLNRNNSREQADFSLFNLNIRSLKKLLINWNSV